MIIAVARRISKNIFFSQSLTVNDFCSKRSRTVLNSGGILPIQDTPKNTNLGHS